VHYLPQFGAAFSGGLFVWILCLLASAGNPAIAKLPETLLNIILAWITVYLCYFWIFPYRPHPVFLSLLRRTRIRLGKRLQDAIAYFNTELEGQDAFDLMRNDILDQRIVSLMTTQDWLIQRIARRKQLSEGTIARYRQALATHEELFAAILVLEQSLLILKSTTSVPVQLQSYLTRLGQQIFTFLEQSASPQSPESLPQFDPACEQWLQDYLGNIPTDKASYSPTLTETLIQKQNIQRSFHTLLSKVRAVATLPIQLGRTADV
jgi:hypothetical protein